MQSHTSSSGRFARLHWAGGFSRVELWLTTLLGVSLLIIATIAAWRHWRREPGLGSELRLVGVRPDAGDLIFDPQGRPLTNEFFGGDHMQSWGSHSLRRDFILETTQPHSGVSFVRLGVRIAKRYQQAMMVEALRLADGRQRFEGVFHVPRVLPKRILWFYTYSQPIERVDLEVTFFPSTLQPGELRFAGPFEVGQLVQAGPGTLIPQNDRRDSGLVTAEFTCRLPEWPPEDLGAFVAMTLKGEARMLLAHSRKPTGNGVEATLSGSGVSLASIDCVLVRRAVPVTIPRVQVQYPGRPARDYPLMNDQLVSVLKLNNTRPRDVGNYKLSGPQEALRALPVLRGPKAIDAWQVIRSAPPPFDLDALPPEQMQMLRETALLWANVPHHRVALAGIQMGIGRWPEFAEPALRLAERAPEAYANGAAGALASMAHNLQPEMIQQICEYLRQPSEGRLCGEDSPGLAPWQTAHTYLLRVLAKNTSGGQAALCGFVADPRPSIWFRAARVVHEHGIACTNLTPLILTRLQVARSELPPPTGSLTNAAALVRDLSPKLFASDPQTFYALYRQVRDSAPRESMLPVLIESLPLVIESPYKPLALAMLQQFNAWCDVNVGGVGTRTPSPTKPTPIDWDQARRDFQEWASRSGHLRQPADPAPPPVQ